MHIYLYISTHVYIHNTYTHIYTNRRQRVSVQPIDSSSCGSASHSMTRQFKLPPRCCCRLYVCMLVHVFVCMPVCSFVCLYVFVCMDVCVLQSLTCILQSTTRQFKTPYMFICLIYMLIYIHIYICSFVCLYVFVCIDVCVLQSMTRQSKLPPRCLFRV